MVFIKDLNKNIFPGYIPPEKNELFSSWYCRLAISHGVKPLTFVKNNFEYNAPIFNRDIDLQKPQYLVDFLLLHTPLNIHDVNDLFLTSLKDLYFNNLTETKSFFLSLGINHRNRKKFGTMCCPSCLKKNPYYKKEWRLFTSIICTECNSYLIDKCQYCSHPICFHQIYNGSNQSIPNLDLLFSMCGNCKNDLSTTPLPTPSKFELEYQNFINQTLILGFNQYANYSFLFINGLILLCRCVRGTRLNKFNRLLSMAMKDLYNVELTQLKKETGLWTHTERKNTLPYVYNFIKKSPENFNNLNYFKISKSYLSPYDRNINYWILSMFDL